MMSTRDAVSSLLQSCLDTDNNVFNESRGRPVLSRPPLQQSLSLPLDRYYQSDHPGPGAGDATFPPARLPAPRTVERRTQSIGDSSTAPYQILGADVAGLTSRQVSATAAASPTRYKTELCRPYEENGSCRYGSKCQFAHGKAELRSVVRHPKYKTDLCRTYHTTGLCPYGPRCHFIHNDDERRTTTGDCSAAEQLHRQLAAAEEIGRRSTSIQRGLDDRPRLQRQYSEYRPRPDASQTGGVPAAPGNPRGAGNSGTDLQRRASAVADSVIRRSVGYQRHLQTVAEVDPLSVRIAAAKSLGSAAESFSSASSSVTDSPSPSPTAGLHPPAVEDSPPVRQPVAGWTPPDCETARTALLAELVSRLGPQDIAAALIRALQLPGTAAAAAGSPLPRDLDLGREAELSSMRQLHPDIWTQYLQQQQQQHQRAAATSNVCW